MAQREKVYNKLLPYASTLDEESDTMLQIIKMNLGLSVVRREIRPGCDIWTARLKKYIRLYGLKFSKEDHINFINTMFELILVPFIEPNLFLQFIQVLISLLKKKELISPEELTLPWKPVYNLCKTILFSSQTYIGMYGYNNQIEKQFVSFIAYARYYFSASATTEMLDLWKPMLCPFDTDTLGDAIRQMSYFLPIIFISPQPKKEYELWLDDLMTLWRVCNNKSAWESDLMGLIALLAQNNVGYIDWEPYIPLMFSRFIKRFHLPVCYKQPQSCDFRKYNVSFMALWIVSVLGGGGQAQIHLSELMRVLESYFHSSNTGKWNEIFGNFLEDLTVHFVKRLNYERYKMLTWQKAVPNEKKLNEDDITMFVSSLKLVIMRAMFSSKKSSVKVAIQYLAMLRPYLIIPDLIESFYFHMEDSHKPHHYRAVLQCLDVVLRPMLEKTWGFKEGPSYVVPLLMAVLPGIDPNDCEKSLVTFDFIKTMVTLVPIVDCSKATQFCDNLSQEEENLCIATSTFADFILKFMDHCFTFITSSSLELIHLEQGTYEESTQESVVLFTIYLTFSTIFQQTSLELFQVGLDKLYRFVTENVLETKVAGRLLGGICQSFAQGNGDLTLQKFVPFLGNNILSLISSDNALLEDSLSIELLYYMKLLSEIVLCPGKYIMPHYTLLSKVLDVSLQLSSCEGQNMALHLLQALLDSLLSITPLEYHSVPYLFEEQFSLHLPIRDWGKPGDVNDLKLTFFVPGETEIEGAKLIVEILLPQQIQYINGIINNSTPLVDDKLEFHLSIIRAILRSKCLFPSEHDSPLHLVDSYLRDDFFYTEIQKNEVVNKQNFITLCNNETKKNLVNVLNELQMKLVTCKEQNNKSLVVLTQIWGYLMTGKYDKTVVKSALLLYNVLKQYSGSYLLGSKSHNRGLIISRVSLQHDLLKAREILTFTNMHKCIMLNLLELCTSHYSNISTEARDTLANVLSCFHYSYSLMIPKLSEFLQKDATLEPDVVEGAARLLLQPVHSPIIVYHDLILLRSILPFLVKARSEKLTIINLFTLLERVVSEQLGTISLNFSFSADCIMYGTKLCESASYKVTNELIDRGAQNNLQRHQFNMEQYFLLLDTLVTLEENESSCSRSCSMTISFLSALIHPDVRYPPKVVKFLLFHLLNESIFVRNNAIIAVTMVLKQQKRTRKKMQVDPYNVAGAVQKTSQVFPGDRPDNQWVKYREPAEVKNSDSWNKLVFAHREYHGYYCWPPLVTLYAPANEQLLPPLADPSFMKPEEEEVNNFFSDTQEIEKLIFFLSIEGEKGKEIFSEIRYYFFKGLFRNGGYPLFKKFIPHLMKLISSRQESSQKCASEILAGAMRGMKHWPFTMFAEMWNSLEPILESVYQCVNEETLDKWLVFFTLVSHKRDPRWNLSLFKLVFNYPVQSNTFLEVARLSFVQCCVVIHEWRMSEVLSGWLKTLKRNLSSQFADIRHAVGQALCCVFDADLQFPGGNPPNSPRISDFVKYALPLLSSLYDVEPKIDPDHKKQSRRKEKDPSSDPEKSNAIKFLKTLCVWIISMTTKSLYGISEHIYELIPLICLMENYDDDPELMRLCGNVLNKVSQSIHDSNIIKPALSAMQKTSDFSSWRAHVVCLKFLQVFVFYNMPVILRSNDWTSDVISIVLKLLEDFSLEVREKSAQVLCDLLHTGFIKDEAQLLLYFKEKIGNTKNKLCQIREPTPLKLHHGDVLALCAFINAYPYDVPDFIPELFPLLQNHLSDPHPIPQSIRKTITNFQRTHHDKWAQHRLKFNDMQLRILEDITEPASHYA